MYFLSLFMLCLSYSNLQIAQAQVSTKIIGGTTTTAEKYNFHIALYSNGGYTCGGSVIDPKYVILAAHCVFQKSNNSLLVRGGRTLLSSTGGVSSRVEKIILPKDYNPNNMHYDIAALKLSTPFTSVRTISLFTGVIPVGAIVTVIGWGYTSQGGSISNQLREVQLTMISKRQCQNAYGNQAKLTNTQMCATQPGKDSCNGDSGGALLYEGKLAGIVSWGIGCAQSQYPGVYTNIPACLKFIDAAQKV